MKNKKLILAYIITALIVIFFIHTYTAHFVNNISRTAVIVERVIDGDTVVTSTGEYVRLLGINTPEEGQFYYDEATNALEKMIVNKPVVLEMDTTNTDRDGRLLRYIFLDDKFVNFEMVKNGYAHVYLVAPNLKYSNELLRAQRYAKNNSIGIWKPSKYSGCIKLADFSCFGDEFVKFENICDDKYNLSGWYVTDEFGGKNHVYKFGGIVLGENDTITLHTGHGLDNSTDLFWNRKAIWNNDRDTVFLRDEEGLLVLSYSYH